MADAGAALPPVSGAAALEAVTVFRGLAPVALERVAALARIEILPAGIDILRQGDPADRACALLAGGVRIRQTGSDGAQALMRMIAPGDMFGTIALYTDQRYPADAETAMASRIASWSAADFLSLTGQYPPMAVNIIRMVGKRLAEAQDRIRELSTQGAEQRIAHAMLRLAAQAIKETEDGMQIAIPLRRRDLAELAGTTLHTASRLLTQWQTEGLVMSSKKLLTIRDLRRMRVIAEGCHP